MADTINLSKIKRDKLLSKIELLKQQTEDEDTIAVLNEVENELTKKKYGLVWEEHSEKVDEQMKNNIPVFVEDKDKEIIFDKSLPFNFLLEGDNLHSLKLLEKTHKGKIDVIYIDPPYNTGNNDFVYNDSYIASDDNYRHSKWLSFIERRLIIAKKILANEGVIFISIDDNEICQLKLLCDQIFGENNFINIISVNMNSLSGVKMIHAINGKRYPAQKEYVLLYKKQSKELPLFIDKIKKEKWDKEYNLIVPELTKDIWNTFSFQSDECVNLILKDMKLISLTEYAKENKIKISDDNWKWENAYRIFGTKSNRPLARKMRNESFEQDIVCYTNNDGNKRFFYSGFNRKVKDPRIELVQAESNSSVFLSDNWIDISNDGGVAQEGGVIFPNGKKPLSLIKRILRTCNNSNAIVLDFFAGSGTTAQAVLELNREDRGNRKFIICTNNENNICEEITYERCRTVITGKRKNNIYYSEGIPANLKYYKTDFIPKINDGKLSETLLNSITELIKLEHHCEIDNHTIKIAFNDDEMDRIDEQHSSLCKRVVNSELIYA